MKASEQTTERPRERVRIRQVDRPVALETTPGPDGHVHVARFDDVGYGRTDTVLGHFHFIDGLDVTMAKGHIHQLTRIRR